VHSHHELLVTVALTVQLEMESIIVDLGKEWTFKEELDPALPATMQAGMFLQLSILGNPTVQRSVHFKRTEWHYEVTARGALSRVASLLPEDWTTFQKRLPSFITGMWRKAIPAGTPDTGTPAAIPNAVIVVPHQCIMEFLRHFVPFIASLAECVAIPVGYNDLEYTDVDNEGHSMNKTGKRI
jgi:hypothetical protein